MCPQTLILDAAMRLMHPWILRPLVLLATTTMVSIPASAQGPSPASVAEVVSLSPGDSVRVVVWRKPEMSGDFIVGPDGTITHPLYKAVRVGGIPFSTAEVNVRNFLARFEQDPQFVLEPLVRQALEEAKTRR